MAFVTAAVTAVLSEKENLIAPHNRAIKRKSPAMENKLYSQDFCQNMREFPRELHKYTVVKTSSEFNCSIKILLNKELRAKCMLKGHLFTDTLTVFQKWFEVTKEMMARESKRSTVAETVQCVWEERRTDHRAKQPGLELQLRTHTCPCVALSASSSLCTIHPCSVPFLHL